LFVIFKQGPSLQPVGPRNSQTFNGTGERGSGRKRRDKPA
jgi:hypothetical protein